MISALDTQRFGFPVAKVNQYPKDPELTIQELKSQGVQLVLSKIPLQEITLINQLEQLGFELRDVQATYRLPLAKELSPIISDTSTITIREVVESDIQALEKMAYDSFYNYGHYARNPKLDKSTCADIYADWIRNSCTQPQVADVVFVAVTEETPVGFLSFKRGANHEGSFAAGGIGAMLASQRNKGIFKLLTHHGALWAQHQQLDWVEHNVLIDNTPVNKSLSKSGYTMANTFVTLHLWIDL